MESQFFAGLFATDDAAAGMRSFVQDGPGEARFTGGLDGLRAGPGRFGEQAGVHIAHQPEQADGVGDGPLTRRSAAAGAAASHRPSDRASANRSAEWPGTAGCRTARVAADHRPRQPGRVVPAGHQLVRRRQRLLPLVVGPGALRRDEQRAEFGRGVEPRERGAEPLGVRRVLLLEQKGQPHQLAYLPSGDHRRAEVVTHLCRPPDEGLLLGDPAPLAADQPQPHVGGIQRTAARIRASRPSVSE